MSAAEHDLEVSLRLRDVPAIREYRFGAEACGGPGRGLRERLKAAGLKDWRADFAILDHSLLIEIEGGGWTGGRHTTGAGFEADLIKYDAAMRLGWNVYRCSPGMVTSGQAIKTIMQLLDGSRHNGSAQSK
jgi:very-short-patch-repair endonuclease